jgi:hypothetical protein
MKYFQATHGMLIYVVDDKRYRAFGYKRGPKGKWHKYRNTLQWLNRNVGNFRDTNRYTELKNIPSELV